MKIGKLSQDIRTLKVSEEALLTAMEWLDDSIEDDEKDDPGRDLVKFLQEIQDNLQFYEILVITT